MQDLLNRQGLSSQLEIIKTTGDVVQDRFLHEIGGKGLFVKELEQALRDKKADIAVHSLKDMPAVIQKPFALVAILHRHEVSDAIIFKSQNTKSPASVIDASALQKLACKKIATSSLRRQSYVKKYSPTTEVVGLRGNVDTRLKKLQEQDWDAIILAEASLERLSLKKDLVWQRLSTDSFVPCAGQGALAIEILTDHPLFEEIAQLDCKKTRYCVELERKVLEMLGADCTMPLGCFVKEFGDKQFKLQATLLNLDGQTVEIEYEFNKNNVTADKVVWNVLGALKTAGANDILRALKLKPIEI